MFDELPRVYEFINHIVSLGLDISWRKRAASLAAASLLPSHSYLVLKLPEFIELMINALFRY
jgi:ubiquinone/menaquinone biosynthesis C-methylase UbiE